MRNVSNRFVAVNVAIFMALISSAANAQVVVSEVSTVWAHRAAVPLFDGATFDGWQTGKGDAPDKGWEIVDGSIHRASKGGHLFSKKEYENFELRFQWKIAEGSNSGIKYRVRDFGGKTLGCEFQMLDDKPGKEFEKGATGSLYAMYPPSEAKSLRPAGEWNSSRIVVRGNLVEHWLNNRQIVQADTYSADWRNRLNASKFSDHSDFGQPGPGRIMLQDHGGEVWFRDLVLVPLERVWE